MIFLFFFHLCFLLMFTKRSFSLNENTGNLQKNCMISASDNSNKCVHNCVPELIGRLVGK